MKNKLFKSFLILLSGFIIFIVYQTIDYMIQEQRELDKIYGSKHNRQIAEKLEKELTNQFKEYGKNLKPRTIFIEDLLTKENIKVKSICVNGLYFSKKSMKKCFLTKILKIQGD